MHFKYFVIIVLSAFISNMIFSQSTSLSSKALDWRLSIIAPHQLETINNFNFREGVDVSVGDNVIGVESGILFSMPITPKIGISAGILGGVNTYSIQFLVVRDFLSYQEPVSFTSRSYEFRNLYYTGITVLPNYRVLSHEKWHLNIEAGVDAIYYFPKDISFSDDIPMLNGEEKEVFNYKAKVNPENRMLFIPILGLSGNYNLNDFWSVGIHSKVTLYSQKRFFETVQPYQLIGDKETITGSFYKRHLLVGIGAGVKRLF